MAQPDLVDGLARATLALERAVENGDLDAVDEALRERARWIDALGRACSGHPVPKELAERIARVLESDQRCRSVLTAIETTARQELTEVRIARAAAASLSPGPTPARFVNDLI